MARPKKLEFSKYHAQVVFAPRSADEPNSEEALLALSDELSASGMQAWQIDRVVLLPVQTNFRTGIKGFNMLVL